VWSSALKPDSPLLSLPAAAKLPGPGDASVLGDLASLLLLQHPQRLDKLPGEWLSGCMGWGWAAALHGSRDSGGQCKTRDALGPPQATRSARGQCC
jgi:hypothetical protein